MSGAPQPSTVRMPHWVGQPLRRVVLGALASAGTWVARADLDRLSTCAPALDDVLADLVAEGRAEHQPAAGYRLALSPLARQALQQLQQEPGLQRALKAKTFEKNGRSLVRIGVAERRAELAGGAVTYDAELPVCEGPAAALEQAQAFMDLCAKEMRYVGD